jgi:hypothetical protein
MILAARAAPSEIKKTLTASERRKRSMAIKSVLLQDAWLLI